MTNIQLPQFPEPFWRDSVNISSFPSLEESTKAEVGIVGGGITGITAAYILSKQNVDVVLIDASNILNGTTGHTTAKITAQHGLIYDELISHFGLEKTSLYYEAQTEAKQFIKQTTKELNIDCDLNKEDAYIYTMDDHYIRKLENEKKAYDQLNIESELVDKIPLDLPVKSALIMKNQAQFHPLKYLEVLVKEMVKNGVKIYENTTAIDVEYNQNPTILTKNNHRIACNHIISASHFPFYDKQSFYFSRMYPERSYVIAAKTKTEFPGGMYINAESPTRSIRSTDMGGENLWVIGGESHKTGQGKTTIEYYEALKQFAIDHFDIQDIVYRWSAQDLITLDKLPYIGPISKSDESILVATGFRKWGITNGILAAKILSDYVLDKENKYKELFTPSRFEADPMVKKFMEINADVAKHLVKGKLEYTDNNIENLETDHATVVRINGQRTGVYKDKEENIHMVDTTCTHMGCEVKWNSGERTWDCPCHGSRFSFKGEVIEGPAKKPLQKRELN